jgi:hypothetical protein
VGRPARLATRPRSGSSASGTSPSHEPSPHPLAFAGPLGVSLVPCPADRVLLGRRDRAAGQDTGHEQSHQQSAQPAASPLQRSRREERQAPRPRLPSSGRDGRPGEEATRRVPMNARRSIPGLMLSRSLAKSVVPSQSGRAQEFPTRVGRFYRSRGPTHGQPHRIRSLAVCPAWHERCHHTPPVFPTHGVQRNRSKTERRTHG